ncbi:hypothetical protein V8G54_030607 [Vigna mungo]|uniref:CCHC-type domain-containing protein n=1 Tax=Vigna mungo TaxID=3915 RepID=A0AAQ3RLF8_VIGMU
MVVDEGKIKIEKFNGTEFGFWKMQIKDYLYQKKLYQPLSGHRPVNMKDEDWILLDRQDLGVIRLTLSHNVVFNIAKEKTTMGLMTALSIMYEKSLASKKVHLMRRLFNLWMLDGAMVAQHFNELNIVTTQLSSVGIEFDDEVRALILLECYSNNKLKFDDVRDLILSEEIRRKKSGESSTSLVLHTESRGRSLNRGYGRGRSKERGSNSKNHRCFQNSKTIECCNCGKVGHYKNECKGGRKNHEDKVEENVASTSGGEDALICSLENKEDILSCHLTKEFFENYVLGNLGKVYLGNEQSCEIAGKGVVKIKLNGSVWDLKNANGGYTTVFHGDHWKISKGAMTFARGRKSGTLYKTEGACHLIAIAMNEDPNL